MCPVVAQVAASNTPPSDLHSFFSSLERKKEKREKGKAHIVVVRMDGRKKHRMGRWRWMNGGVTAP